MSLAETPAIKAKPPLCPLLRLCLITEKITGPTEMLNSNPNANPFASAAIFGSLLNKSLKKWLRK